MKQLFLILASLLVFSSVGEDTIRLHFNDRTYVKSFPKNYEEAKSTIRSMEGLFNYLDSTCSIVLQSNDRMKEQTAELIKIVEASLENINSLTIENDSLNKTIYDNSVFIQEKTKVYTDSIDVLLSKIKEKSIVNVGLKLSCNGSLDKNVCTDFTISPMLTYKKLFTSVNFGIYSKKYDYFSRRIGFDLGYFLF